MHGTSVILGSAPSSRSFTKSVSGNSSRARSTTRWEALGNNRFPAALVEPPLPAYGVNAQRCQPVGQRGLSYHDGSRVLANQRNQLFVGQPVVQRDEGHPGPGGPEETDREAKVVAGDVDESGGVRLAQPAGRPACLLQQLGSGEALGPADERRLVGRDGGDHFQQRCDVHFTVIQSEEGSGLASFSGMTRPSQVSVPEPPFVQSSSMPVSAST